MKRPGEPSGAHPGNNLTADSDIKSNEAGDAAAAAASPKRPRVQRVSPPTAGDADHLSNEISSLLDGQLFFQLSAAPLLRHYEQRFQRSLNFPSFRKGAKSIKDWLSSEHSSLLCIHPPLEPDGDTWVSLKQHSPNLIQRHTFLSEFSRLTLGQFEGCIDTAFGAHCLLSLADLERLLALAFGLRREQYQHHIDRFAQASDSSTGLRVRNDIMLVGSPQMVLYHFIHQFRGMFGSGCFIPFDQVVGLFQDLYSCTIHYRFFSLSMDDFLTEIITESYRSVFIYRIIHDTKLIALSTTNARTIRDELPGMSTNDVYLHVCDLILGDGYFLVSVVKRLFETSLLGGHALRLSLLEVVEKQTLEPESNAAIVKYSSEILHYRPRALRHALPESNDASSPTIAAPSLPAHKTHTLPSIDFEPLPEEDEASPENQSVDMIDAFSEPDEAREAFEVDHDELAGHSPVDSPTLHPPVFDLDSNKDEITSMGPIYISSGEASFSRMLISDDDDGASRLRGSEAGDYMDAHASHMALKQEQEHAATEDTDGAVPTMAGTTEAHHVDPSPDIIGSHLAQLDDVFMTIFQVNTRTGYFGDPTVPTEYRT
ncbi:uncharacterized protein BJ171DRAFT_579200 [Polychytrium aggregatum]|uniref:uncharacterized protein n=1 Tax=Polychytrium aggregatum TaxID=110093 RepID=UPI0022FDF48E|nr:uncharacterized protein BJ171DRAFT_579200 [Polychytrium aggregatum]KAI9206837.1 hypothetical protein BJ171DRAFT_579200 [Polychytrium aggregatum]